MKKLYENIENIHIKGDISQLSEVVTAIDIALQSIADNTDQLVGQLKKYSASNMGSQYENVVNQSMQLRDTLFEASLELNEMQNQVVEYQNKIYRYEELSESAQRPNPYLVSKGQNVQVKKKVMQFNRDEMMQLAAMLRNYSEKVFRQTKIINEKKDSIAGVWQDVQYRDFSEFIDLVSKKIVEALKVFEEYVVYLIEKIKELG